MILLVILLVVVTTGLVEILGLPFADKGSDIINSFLSISTMAGLMTAFDLSASRGLYTRWISMADEEEPW